MAAGKPTTQSQQLMEGDVSIASAATSPIDMGPTHRFRRDVSTARSEGIASGRKRFTSRISTLKQHLRSPRDFLHLALWYVIPVVCSRHFWLSRMRYLSRATGIICTYIPGTTFSRTLPVEHAQLNSIYQIVVPRCLQDESPLACLSRRQTSTPTPRPRPPTAPTCPSAPGE